MLNTITNADRIAQAQAALEKQVQAAATRSGPVKLGWQGGGSEEMIYFIAPLNQWVALADSGNRYWNALGIGNPFRDSRTIIAEINPPKSGLDRRISGLFLKDGTGNVWLAHRGRVGGGRKGIGKEAFLAWYPESTPLVNDAGEYREVIVIGALDDKRLLEKLAAFTRNVASFKNAAVSGK